MLQCAANISMGNDGKDCSNCGILDNECHRINVCPLWSKINLANTQETIDYSAIHSDNVKDVMRVVEIILRMWDLGNGNNSMRDDGADNCT